MDRQDRRGEAEAIAALSILLGCAIGGLTAWPWGILSGVAIFFGFCILAVRIDNRDE